MEHISILTYCPPIPDRFHDVTSGTLKDRRIPVKEGAQCVTSVSESLPEFEFEIIIHCFSLWDIGKFNKRA